MYVWEITLTVKGWITKNELANRVCIVSANNETDAIQAARILMEELYMEVINWVKSTRIQS